MSTSAASPKPPRERIRVRVEGIVQGVGFRPAVHRLAGALRLVGWVANDPAGVTIEVEGPAHATAAFLIRLPREAPPLAVIETIASAPVPLRGEESFTIAPSEAGEERTTPVSPDVATCDDCLRELFDPADRRHRYPFINCTNCGPRFTIVTDVPYDRPATTMGSFEMCADCAREYHDPADRRFHAQPIACPACGPRLVLEHGRTATLDRPLERTVELLRAGAVVALKGIGGYHVACDAASEPAVALLRSRKHREEKPFALMARDAEAVERFCVVGPEERRLLESVRRPIVLLRRRDDAPVARSVAPGNRSLGFMLPYTPLHHLLLAALDEPIVLTSGNLSDEPIAYRDDDARERLAGVADAFLTHDRPIHVRCDDSVVRASRGGETVLRRARGYAPQPVALAFDVVRPILACGAELKNTFCVAKGRRAFVSHHIGDLENYETLRSFTEGIEHYRRLFDVHPDVVAYDLHPEYLSTKWALERGDVDLVAVQHHHAHIASCLADNRHAGPAIGVAFDGLGYGTDGVLWGGELLVADLTGFERAGHLEAVPMPGGAAAIREPWRMAMTYLERAFGEAPAGLEVVRRAGDRWAPVRSALAVNAPLTTSVGRLFDAVAALCGVRDRISYEGQAAIELEQLADEAEDAGYPVDIRDGAVFEISGAGLVRAAAEDLLAGAAPAAVAMRFHNAVAAAVARACDLVRDRTGLGVVALSGGVFQNMLLLGRVVPALERHGFTVLTHSRVPPNDGGISLGQVAVAAHAAVAPR